MTAASLRRNLHSRQLFHKQKLLSKIGCEDRSMKLEIPAGPFRAYLFDCDGTIADSMPLHYVAWSQALAKWNCPFPEDLFYSWGGMPADEAISTLNRRHGLSMPVQHVAECKESLYYDLLPQLQPVP